MEHLTHSPLLTLAKVVSLLLLLGLPAMCGLSVWQTVQTKKVGDEALSRSWADAAKSFFGMMLASWVLAWLGFWAVRYVLSFLDQVQGG